jgi:hypothetical protein
VVTVTPTVTPAWAGVTALSCVGDSNVTDDDAVVPNRTVAPGTKFVPVTVIILPPAVGPAFGLTSVAVGGPQA